MPDSAPMTTYGGKKRGFAAVHKALARRRIRDVAGSKAKLKPKAQNRQAESPGSL